MERRSYTVRAMHCGRCERAIRERLEGLDGVVAVNPDASTCTVEVRYDPARVGDQQLRAQLVHVGFPVDGETPDDDQPRRGDFARYLLLVLAVAAVAVAGYAGYVLYPRFDLPAVEGAAVLGLAAAAGVASFFSPCSFPLLLGILGHRASARAQEAQPATRPVVFGGALAVGAGGFLLLAGLTIAVGGGVLFDQVTFDSPAGITIRSIVGLLLVLLGLIQVGLIPTPFHAVERSAQPLLRRQARLRRAHPVAGYGLFGFAYVLAGFG